MTSPNPILLKQLNDYKKPHSDYQPSQPLHKADRKPSLLIKLINFEFYPKKLRIPIGTTIRWEIGPNQSVYSSIYNTCERSFFLSIDELDIQSPQLFPGSSFEHIFTKEGVFEIVCLNYSRVKSIVTVIGDGKINDPLENNSNNSYNLPIHYNRELKLADKLEEKKKEVIENQKKSYLDDFPNDFLSQIDHELDFQMMENEVKIKKETSESESKTTEVLDVSNSLPLENEATPKKLEFKYEECVDLN